MNISFNDSCYPRILREIDDAPEKLYYKGDINLLKKTCIAIVGTRKSSNYGEVLCDHFIKELSSFDVCIVSGLALGIDTCAHKSALKYGLKTIAVLGTGIDKIYPRSNYELYEKIEKKGLIISELDRETDAKKYTFVLRNRIISGISIACLVVEAPDSSGALITARSALNQGRDVFTIPQDIDKVNGRGPLKLIQEGVAFPVSSAKDMIKTINESNKLFNMDEKTKFREIFDDKINVNVSNDEKKVLNTLSLYRSKSYEEIVFKTGFAFTKVLSLLSILEVKGFIKMLNGKYLKSL